MRTACGRCSRSIITVPPGALEPLLDGVLAACVRKVREKSEFDDEYRTALELGERYPGDPGVIASLLMNRITLQPNEAIYLPAGNLHAYLSGVGVEIMASSATTCCAAGSPPSTSMCPS